MIVTKVICEVLHFAIAVLQIATFFLIYSLYYSLKKLKNETQKKVRKPKAKTD